MEKIEINGNAGASVLIFLTGLGTGLALTSLLALRSGTAMRGLFGRKEVDAEDWLTDKAAAEKDYVMSHEEVVGDQVKGLADVVGRSCEE